MFKLVLFSMLFLSNICLAHQISGSERQIQLTLVAISKSEVFLNHQFQPLQIEIVNSKRAYRQLLSSNFNISSKKVSYLVANSVACGIWNSNIIYFNAYSLTGKEFQFYMIHELIHKYQFTLDPDAIYTKRSFLEKQAISLSKQISH